MEEIRIDLSGEVQLSAATKLRNAIENCNRDTILNITIDANDEGNSTNLFTILENNNMKFLTKGTNFGKKLEIVAHRRN